MTTMEATRTPEAPALPATAERHTMEVLPRRGVAEPVVWHLDDDAEIVLAGDMFSTLRRKGYFAYAELQGGTGGVQLLEFDPREERIFMLAPLQGG